MKNFYKTPLIVFLSLAPNFFAQNTYVPDDNFEAALISLGYDDVLDDYVLTENISGLKVLYLENQSISDLTGIEDFSQLELLNLQENLLTSIDLSKQTQLKELWLNFNKLETLDLSSNTLLVTVMVHQNELTELITDGAVALEFLECSANNLHSIDVSKNINLMAFDISMNPLKEIDLEALIKLDIFVMMDTEIARLDLSKNQNLEGLYCYNNAVLNELIVKGAQKLEHLDCSENSIIELDLSENLLLKELSCHSNQLASLDLSGLSNLEYAWIDNNQLSSLKTEGALALKQIDCANNKIVDLDFSTNANLNFFNSRDNALKSLNLRNGNNENIFEMDARNNPLLSCIQVDDATYATTNWTNIDDTSFFAEDCLYVLDVADEKLDEGLLLYPNPVNSDIYFDAKFSIASVEIYSSIGQQLIVFKKPQESLDLSALDQGLYLIRIISEKGIFTRRFLKN